MAPIVDAEFCALIPPPSPEELAGLEEDLKRDGCRDALVVWRGLLLDGHNRFEICTRLGLPYKTVEVDLPDRDAAADWIDANQLHRRNLTADQRTLLIGRRYARTKKPPHRPPQEKGGQNVHLPAKTAETIAADAGVDERTVRRAAKAFEFVEKLAETEPEKAKAIRDGKTKIVEAKRAVKEAKREGRRRENSAKVAGVKPVNLVTAGAKFATIVIDPPWDWGDEGDVDQLGRAKPTYATMTIAELLKLPVATLADVDAHLYLWITNRSMPKGFQLLEAWEFRFITILTWPKPTIGMGNYFRGQTEHILFGVRGSQPLKRKNASTLLPDWPRGPHGHSSKPVELSEFVESCSPGPYLEMFSRSKRTGWTEWGEGT